MKIAVTTPTGNIGSRLAAKLLDAGAEVTLLVRNPAKVKPLVSRGARALAGDLADPEFVTRSLSGVDALFWLTPGDPRAADMRASQRRLGEAASRAVRAAGTPRVVNLSSIGAQLPAGTGPIAGLHEVEKALNESGAAVRHVRSAYFMENYLWSLGTIRTMGSIFLPIPGSVRIPMIATRDIAGAAAGLLLDGSWTGQEVLGLHGSRDLSFDEAAAAIAEGIQRPVRHVPVTPDQAREAMLGMGSSASATDLYLEMCDAMTTGRLTVAEPRTPATTTPTTVEVFARESLKPLL